MTWWLALLPQSQKSYWFKSQQGLSFMDCVWERGQRGIDLDGCIHYELHCLPAGGSAASIPHSDTLSGAPFLRGFNEGWDLWVPQLVEACLSLYGQLCGGFGPGEVVGGMHSMELGAVCPLHSSTMVSLGLCACLLKSTITSSIFPTLRKRQLLLHYWLVDAVGWYSVVSQKVKSSRLSIQPVWHWKLYKKRHNVKVYVEENMVPNLYCDNERSHELLNWLIKFIF